MGRRGATESAVSSRSPWPDFGTDRSGRCSWNGAKSTLVKSITPSNFRIEMCPCSVPIPCLPPVPYYCSKTVGQVLLVPGDQVKRRFRASDRQSCGKAGKRPRHCYLCRRAHHHRRGKVTLCFGEQSTDCRRHSCEDTDMRFLSERVAVDNRNLSL